ncbi:50S ribosomal protein L5 [Candidatus Pacearchaeota archaeon]|nr:50S ribosomal protein L5 [Candidatus Pacearchaeota archaeon]
MKQNKMREVRIEKVVLSAGGSGDKLDKGVRLLKLISARQPIKIKSKKRIPSLNVRPGLEVGCKVTIRKNFQQLLKKLLLAINNEIKESQIEKNHFSFGIHEYIEIPGTEYQRDIGILGLNVTIDFTRTGARVKRRKIKKSGIPKRQDVSREEIIEYMKKNYETKITTKEKKIEEDDSK